MEESGVSLVQDVSSVMVAMLTLRIINFATFAKGRTRRNQTEMKRESR